MDMIYTNGNILMADSAQELKQAGDRMNLPETLFEKHPFPHYKLDASAKQKVEEHNITKMHMAEMVYRYYDRNDL